MRSGVPVRRGRVVDHDRRHDPRGGRPAGGERRRPLAAGRAAVGRDEREAALAGEAPRARLRELDQDAGARRGRRPSTPSRCTITATIWRDVPGPVGDDVGHRHRLGLPGQVGGEHACGEGSGRTASGSSTTQSAAASSPALPASQQAPVAVALGGREPAGQVGRRGAAELERRGGRKRRRGLVQREQRDQRHEQGHPEQQGVERPRHERSVRPAPDGPSACGSSHRSGGYSTRDGPQ